MRTEVVSQVFNRKGKFFVKVTAQRQPYTATVENEPQGASGVRKVQTTKHPAQQNTIDCGPFDTRQEALSVEEEMINSAFQILSNGIDSVRQSVAQAGMQAMMQQAQQEQEQEQQPERLYGHEYTVDRMGLRM